MHTHPRVSRARAMSVIDGHNPLFFPYLAIFIDDESGIASIAPKFVFIVAIDKFILVEKFLATIGTNKVFYVFHFIFLSQNLQIFFDILSNVFLPQEKEQDHSSNRLEWWGNHSPKNYHSCNKFDGKSSNGDGQPRTSYNTTSFHESLNVLQNQKFAHYPYEKLFLP
jgi:hypothetical protein